ncbi:MAG: DUF308 domain-containing protein [Pseudobutyrivibrio sp.]|nr:DUF308 domain-containing protein [Pseudobutyrivibrio sp.]
MKQKIKDLRLNITFSAIVSIVIGILLLAFPDKSLVTISRVISSVIIISGVSIIISQIAVSKKNYLGVTVGFMLALVGVWMFTEPGAIASIIPIAIGVILVVHGVQDIGMAFESLRAKLPRTWLTFLLAIINILMGVICIVRAFNVLEFAIRVIGIMLIFDGLVDIGIVHKVRKVSKESSDIIDGTIISEEDI